MHVPGALPQDLDAPCLSHVLSKGKGSGVPAVLLLVLPVKKSVFSKSISNSVLINIAKVSYFLQKIKFSISQIKINIRLKA